MFKTFYLVKEILRETSSIRNNIYELQNENRKEFREIKERLRQIENKLHFIGDPKLNSYNEIQDGLLGIEQRDEILRMLRDYIAPELAKRRTSMAYERLTEEDKERILKMAQEQAEMAKKERIEDEKKDKE